MYVIVEQVEDYNEYTERDEWIVKRVYGLYASQELAEQAAKLLTTISNILTIQSVVSTMD